MRFLLYLVVALSTFLSPSAGQELRPLLAPVAGPKSIKVRRLVIGDVNLLKLDEKFRRARPSVANTRQYQLCLPANLALPVSLSAGQRFVVQANISPSCNPKGWSTSSVFTGPEGLAGNFVEGSAASFAPIGMLVGSLSQVPASGSISESTFQKVFSLATTFAVGNLHDNIARTSGTLYLICNDEVRSYGDNQGSIQLTITIYPAPSYP